MTYQISYDVIYPTSSEAQAARKILRTEYFHTEQEALNRAQELLEATEHHAISVVDSAGNVRADFRVQQGSDIRGLGLAALLSEWLHIGLRSE